MITFKSYLSNILLNEGGAAGHMAHPFDLPNIKNGRDLISFFNTAAQIVTEQPASLKIDGINTSFKLITNEHGDKEFAIDRGSMKPLDVRGITLDKLIERFGEGHGMVVAGKKLLTILNTALPIIQPELKALGLWSNSKKFLNTEYVSAKTNVQEYNESFLAIHGVNMFKQVTPKRRESVEVKYDKKAMESLIQKLNPVAKGYDFVVYGSVPASMERHDVPTFEKTLNVILPLSYEPGKIVHKSLGEWLRSVVNPFDTRVKTLDGRKIGVLSKQVYMHLLSGQPASTIVGDDVHDQQLCIDGAVIYHATRVLGRELLAAINTPMGKGNEHEGIVLRDKRLGPKPVKITGDFIVKGLESVFRK